MIEQDGVEFLVPGEPVPQGSMTAMKAKGQDRAFVVPNNKAKLNKYRDAVRAVAASAMGDRGPVSGTVAAILVFHLKRPQAHFTVSGELKGWAPRFHTGKLPDLDKLVRAVLDALTGTVYADDARVVRIVTEKLYANGRDGSDERGGPRTFVRIRPLEEQGGNA